MPKDKQYIPKGPYEVQINCQVCGEEFTSKTRQTIYCIKHRGYKPLTCLVCKKVFYRRIANIETATKTCSKACFVRINEVLGVTKECEICTDKFIPHPTASDKYCKRHRTAWARKAYRKYHGILLPEKIEKPAAQKNPYTVGVIKDCEVKKAVGCTGKMIVFPENWTHCGLCIRPQTGRQVSGNITRDVGR